MSAFVVDSKSDGIHSLLDEMKQFLGSRSALVASLQSINNWHRLCLLGAARHLGDAPDPGRDAARVEPAVPLVPDYLTTKHLTRTLCCCMSVVYVSLIVFVLKNSKAGFLLWQVVSDVVVKGGGVGGGEVEGGGGLEEQQGDTGGHDRAGPRTALPQAALQARGRHIARHCNCRRSTES